MLAMLVFTHNKNGEIWRKLLLLSEYCKTVSCLFICDILF